MNVLPPMVAPTRDDSLERFHGLWRRRRLPCLAIFALVLAAALGIILGLPPVYQAEAKILVDRASLPASVAAPSTPEEIAAKIGALGEETLSRARLADLIARFHLYPAMQAAQDDVVKRMRRDIVLGLDHVAPIGNGATVSLSLSYRGNDPRTIAGVTNALAGYFVEGGGDEHLRQASAAADLLQTQMADLRKTMDAQERKISEYKARHGADLPEQLAANLATIERLNGQIERNRDGQQRVVEKREMRARDAVSESDRALAPEAAQARVERTKNELAELQLKYSDMHPDVKKLQDEIAMIEKSAAAPAAAAPAPAPVVPEADDAAMDRLRDEEKDLQRQVAAYQARVEVAPTREQELSELTRDYDTTRTLYDSLFQRDAETRLAGRLEQHHAGERFRILDAAVPPAQPLGPNRMRLLLLAFAGALGAALGAGLLLERVDTTFHSTDQLEGLDAPLVHGIPRIRTVRSQWRRRLVGALTTAGGLAALSVIFLLTYRLALGNDGLTLLTLSFGS